MILTGDAELDGLPDRQVSQKLARLESERLIAIFAQAGCGHVGKGEGSLGRRVVGGGENEGVPAENRLDVGIESHGDEIRRREMVGRSWNKEGLGESGSRLYQYLLA
jgi:hypothetical protein